MPSYLPKRLCVSTENKPEQFIFIPKNHYSRPGMNLSFCKIFILVLLLPVSALAQSNAIVLAGGYSLPVGKFASQQFNDPEAGFAGDGYFGQLSYERRLTSWLGLRLTGSLNENTTSADPLIEQYSGLLPNPDTYTWQSNVTKWRLGAALLGPMAYTTRGRLTLEAHLQGGMIFARSPGVQVLGSSSTGQNAVDGRITAASTQAFGLGGGGSVRFRLADFLSFQLTGDWIGALAKLENVPTYVKVGNYPTIETSVSRERFVGVINVGAGLVVGF